MKVVSYLNVVPVKNSTKEKTELLTKYIQGVNTIGDTGLIHSGYDLVNCDVAVIQGWQHQRGKGGAHLLLRERIVKHQIQQKKFVCTADSNLFLYATKKNQPHNYLRYSFNGVFPSTGIYFDDNPDPMRWHQLSKDLNIRLQEKTNKGKYILLCMQRNGGWSMDGVDIQDWIINTVKKIRQHTDRAIMLRPHPGDKKAIEYLNHRYNRVSRLPNVIMSKFGTPLEHDLQKCYAVVNHNSSSIVGPIIQGYPAFITDPKRSQCSEVAHHGFENIENPNQFDREKWLHRISMFHWNFDELENGKAWAHMKSYCQ